MSINSGEITMQLSHPLAEEQWDTITDADLEHTNSIWFHTKHGKVVEFVKVIRCKYCEYWNGETKGCVRNPCVEPWRKNDFCSYGGR